jgi:hypothetical protein
METRIDIAKQEKVLEKAQEAMHQFAKEKARPSNCSNNDTFTWSGPSGVLGCTGKRADARLGLRPEQPGIPK